MGFSKPPARNSKFVRIWPNCDCRQRKYAMQRDIAGKGADDGTFDVFAYSTGTNSTNPLDC